MDSQEIQGRFALLRDRFAIPAGAPITVVAADWQPDYFPRIDTVIGQDAIEPHIDAADLVILDNRSCLFDPEGEKDPTAWQPTQDWLLSLRRRGKAVLMAHHSNRLGGARGHSKAEDLLNLIVSLTRPEDYIQDQGARFLVTFDKCRGAHGAAVAPFVAHLTLDGWRAESVAARRESTVAEKLLEHLRVAHHAGARPTSANTAISRARVNRNEGLKEWAALLKAGVIQQHPEGGFYAL